MRYIEVVGGVGICVADCPAFTRDEFTRENVARFLEDNHTGVDWTYRPVEDFHAVCDDKEIPWATEEARETYRHVMELAAEKRRMEPPAESIDRQFFSANISEFLLLGKKKSPLRPPTQSAQEEPRRRFVLRFGKD